MNKIKEELRLKMLGQLSDENTDLDVDNAYGVVKESVLSFSTFLRENYSTQKRLRRSDLEENMWRLTNTDSEFTTEELFKIYENEK